MWQCARQWGKGIEWRVLFVLVLLGAYGEAWAACAAGAGGRDTLQEWKRAGFVVPEEARRERLVATLVACLASPDPALRDGLGYEGLQALLRASALGPDALRALRDRLLVMLTTADKQGVTRPFVALVLSEVARTDRVAPWMRVEERAAMVERAAAYLVSVDDYRGFDKKVGWRHGVAHGADWAMQLAMNPALERAQLERLRDAVAAQAVPASGHAYVFGEPERLARPLLFIAKRNLHDEAAWTAWFTTLPAALGAPALAWKDEGWLARRHDLGAFLRVLYLEADRSEDPGVVKLRPGILAALKTLP
ncbi:DUF2785 domain-containing protein [Myxococcus sp. AB025B]|uniref:DUF2785 domain-containing protein n=1 Tax=Myxococcus sp. AB025B TaxID=2562794 RepID=UPI001143D166|nr:DUF2785 domain-containing protein [Myxococcus sp. AB025B]